MTLIVDAAAMVAATDDSEPLRSTLRAILTAEVGHLVVPAPVSAEIDYLLRRRIGVTLLTLDERHFRAVRSLDGKPFRLLPFDR